MTATNNRMALASGLFASLVLAACNGGGQQSPGQLGSTTGGNSANPDAVAGSSEKSLECLRDHPFITDFQSLIDDQGRYTYNTFDGDEPPLPPNLYRDAPSAAGLPVPAATGTASNCANTDKYRFGIARSDITGPWAGRSRAGYEVPVGNLSGLAQRVYARAFVIGEDCSGTSVVIVNADIGLMNRSVRDALMLRLADDPQLKDIDPNSILLTATHTHNYSGGYSHGVFFSGLHGGHQEDVLSDIIDGIAEAIRAAWLHHLDAEPGSLSLAFNELLHTSENRHRSGYLQNPEAERNQYLDENGNDQFINPLVTQLHLKTANGLVNGLLNWFAVHPTATLDGTLASGDSKGYAAWALERVLEAGNNDLPQPFVAGMLQTDEGDLVQVRYLDNEQEGEPRLPPLLTDVLGEDVIATQANMAINGIRQASNSLALLEQSNQFPVRGAIDYRMRFPNFTEQVVTDPVVLASLQHPDEQDDEVKRTCDPVYGLSSAGKDAFGKYQTCEDGLNVPAEELLTDLQNGDVQSSIGDAAKIALCSLADIDLSIAGGADYSCQAEKAYLFGMGEQGPVFSADDLPFQIVRIGNFAIVALPWEITIMSGRRLRATLLNALAPAGVDFVVIAGLSNEYAGYLTTREEYARQGYEAASNRYGPWTLAAAQQEIRAIAMDMIAGEPQYPVQAVDPHGARIPNTLVADPARADLPTRGPFTTAIADVRDSYVVGEYLRFSYQAAFPNNNTYRNGHYFEIQRQLASGEWQNWITDSDPQAILHWQSNSPGLYLPPNDSVYEIDWFITWDTPPGNYRIVYRTTAKEVPGSEALTEYEAISQTFRIENQNPRCASGAEIADQN